MTCRRLTPEEIERSDAAYRQWWLSVLTPVRARAAVRSTIAAAEAVVASVLEADFAAWTAQPGPEAGI